jgi:DNA-binding transcriptional regulator YiaG
MRSTSKKYPIEKSDKGEQMARNFRELEAKMSPGSRARSDAKAQKMIADMALDELREAREMTQVHLAKILGVNQAAVSKLERRADMYVSTLQSFVKAMGGELKITARFPEGTVEINQFEDVKKGAGARDE